MKVTAVWQNSQILNVVRHDWKKTTSQFVKAVKIQHMCLGQTFFTKQDFLNT